MRGKMSKEEEEEFGWESEEHGLKRQFDDFLFYI